MEIPSISIPYQVLGISTRVSENGQLEVVKRISINGGLPETEVQYFGYEKTGNMTKIEKSTVDVYA